MKEPTLWDRKWTPLSDIIRQTIPAKAMDAFKTFKAELWQSEDPKQHGHVAVGTWVGEEEMPRFIAYMRADGIGPVKIAEYRGNGMYEIFDKVFHGAEGPSKKDIN